MPAADVASCLEKYSKGVNTRKPHKVVAGSPKISHV